MTTVQPITITTPDGVERTLRATLGARKRIAKHFGESDLQAILNKHGDGAIPAVLWCIMHDDKAKPPDISIEYLEENLAPGDSIPLLATVISAFTQGKTSPNEMETLLRSAMNSEVDSVLKQIEEMNSGSKFGVSADSVSDLETTTSGTDSSNVKSTLSPEPIENANEIAPSS